MPPYGVRLAVGAGAGWTLRLWSGGQEGCCLWDRQWRERVGEDALESFRRDTTLLAPRRTFDLGPRRPGRSW